MPSAAKAGRTDDTQRSAGDSERMGSGEGVLMKGVFKHSGLSHGSRIEAIVNRWRRVSSGSHESGSLKPRKEDKRCVKVDATREVNMM